MIITRQLVIRLLCASLLTIVGYSSVYAKAYHCNYVTLSNPNGLSVYKDVSVLKRTLTGNLMISGNFSSGQHLFNKNNSTTFRLCSSSPIAPIVPNGFLSFTLGSPSLKKQPEYKCVLDHYATYVRCDLQNPSNKLTSEWNPKQTGKGGHDINFGVPNAQ